MRRILFLLLAAELISAPDGFQPISGDASCVALDGVTVVTSHGDAVVHWSSFSIAQPEKVFFSQDGPSSAILNRIVGTERSDLLGNLGSNGKVFLVNPAGFFIGQQAEIETSAFVASTLDVLDADFLNKGDLLFSGSSGSIVHLGAIRAKEGDVLLCARSVEARGVLEAKKGSVCIGSGVEFLYQPNSEERLYVRARGPAQEGCALEMDGSIEAANVELKSSNPYGSAIRMNGSIEASRIEVCNGRVELKADGDVAIGGLIRAEGGKVAASGRSVVLQDGAQVDCSAADGGGEVWIGGGETEFAIVEEGAEICVRGLLTGNGGRAFVLGSEAALFAGKIDGRGGDVLGDGGFAEVSGKQIAIPGKVNLLSPRGKVGTFLIDPTNITITSTPGTTGTWSACVPPVSYQINTGTTPNTIYTTDLHNQLETCSVTIDTTSTGGDAGNIIISGAFSWDTANTLTLKATNQLQINADITSSYSSGTFTAMAFTANGTTGGLNGIISISSGRTISTIDGDIHMTAINGGPSNSNGLVITNSTVTTGGRGSIYLTGTGGSAAPPEGVLLSTTAHVTSTSSSASAGQISINGTGGSGSTNAIGITIFNGSTVTTVSGAINLTGTGGGTNAGGFNEGIRMDTNATVTTSGSGAINIMCSSSHGAPAQSGLRMVGAALVTSTSASANAGAITIQGTAAYSNNPYPNNQNLGVVVETNSKVAGISSPAPVLITSILTSNDSNSYLQYNGSVTGGQVGDTTSTGPITLLANSVSIQGKITTQGSITLSPYDQNTSMGIAGAAGSLQWTTTYLGFIPSGYSSLTFTTGSNLAAAAGAITANTFAFPGSVAMSSRGQNGTVTISGALSTSTSGKTVSLTADNATGGQINLNSSITTPSGAVTLTGPVVLGASPSITTSTGGGANVNFSSTINGAQALTFVAGTGTVTFSGAVGGTTPLTNIVFTSAALAQVANNVTVSGANPLNLSVPVSLTGPSTITSNGNNITFGSTLNGAQALTLAAGAGTVTFSGVVGGTTPLTNIVFTSAALAQIANNITVSGANPLNLSVPVSLTGPSTITSNGNNITFGSTLNGAQALTLAAGAGTVTFSGVVGGTTPLTNIVFTSAALAQIANNITVSGANPLNLSVPVSLTGPSTITSNGNNVTFGSTLNGAQALTLAAGAGTVTFSGAVGGTTPLTNIVFTSAALAQIANNITVSGANPLNLSVPVSLTGPSTITSNGNNITFGSTLNGAQALTLAAGAGTVTFSGVVGGTTPLTNIVFTSAALAQIANNITVSGANPLNLSVPVSLTGTSTITSNGNDITFGSTLNGAQALTLAAGAGTVTFSGVVGGTTPLTNIVFTSAALAQIANNITVSGANPLNLSVPVSLTGPSTITSNGNDITFGSTLDGAEVLTLAAGIGTVAFDGAVGGTTPLTNIVFTSAALAQIANNITVSGANPLNLSVPVSLTGPSTITSNGNNITFGSTLNGAQALTLAAGAGTVTFSGVVGGTTPLTNIVFTSAALAQIANNITVSGANPLNLSVPVSLTGTSTITSNGNDITFGSTLDGAEVLTLAAGIGTVAFDGAVGGTTPLTNIVFTSAALIEIGDDITVSGANPLNLSVPVALTGPSTITSNGNDITFGSTLNGAQALTLAAGIGTVAFDGAVGGTTPLTNIVFTSAALVEIGDDITVSGANPLNLSVPVALTGPSTITSNGNDITFGSTLNGAQALTLAAGAGTVTFSGAVGGITPLTNIVFTSAALVEIGDDITVSGANPLNLSVPISLTGPSTITSNGNDITFGSTLNGAQALTLAAGAGTVTFSGVVGGTTPLTNIVFTSAALAQIANNITVSGANPLNLSVPVSLTGTSTITSNGNDITFGSTLNGAQALTLAAGAGTVTFSGVVGGTTPLTNIVFTSAALVQIANNITVSGANPLNLSVPVALTGPSTITSNGNDITFGSTLDGAEVLTLAAGVGTVAFDGAVGGMTPLTNIVFTSAALIEIGDDITVSGANPLNLSVPVSLTGTSTITSNGNDITFGSTLNGAQALTLAAGAGTVTFSGVVGGTTPLTNIVFTSAALAQIANNITVSGANPLNLSVPVALTGPSTITSNGNDITFGSTLNGAQALTLAAGAGTVTFSGAVGGTTPLTNIVFTSAALAQIANNITVSGANPLNLSVPVSLSGPSTITSNGNNITFGSTLNGAQALTLAAGAGTVTFSGVVGGTTPLTNIVFTSAALAQIANNITVSGANPLNLSVPVSLTGTSTITSNGNNITFGSTLNGAQALTLAAGAGTVTFSGVVGGTTPLTNIVFTSAALAQIANNITVSGANPLNLSVPVALTGPSTITSNGNNITFGSTLNGAQALTLAAGAGTVAFDGAVGGTTPLANIVFASAGLVQVGDNIAVSGANPLVFSPSIELTGASIIDTNGASLTFNNTLDGNYSLSIITGLGITAFNGLVGASTPLSTISVASNIAIPSAEMHAQGGTIVFNAPISLVTDTLFSDTGTTGITFNSTISGTHALTIEAPNGAISSFGSISVNSLAASCQEEALFNATIITSGNVDIQSTGNSVIVRTIESTSGNVSLQPASGFSDSGLFHFPDGILVIQDSIAANNGTVFLSPSGRTELLSVATIAGDSTGSDFTIHAQTITIGNNECLTVIGHIALDATVSATVSDVIGRSSVSITAPNISIYKHDPGLIYDASGVLYLSTQTNLLALTLPTLTGVTSTFGPGANPLISAVNVSPDVFTASLVYIGNVLNYDLLAPPPPPPPPPPSPSNQGNARQIAFQSELAITEMQTMRLPILWNLTCTKRDYSCKISCCPDDY